MASEVLPAEVSVDSIGPYSYLSPSGFSVISTDRELACWRILRRGKLAYIERRLFSQREPYGMRICEIAQCILPPLSPCSREKFFRTPASGQHGRTAAKHLSAPLTSTSASTSGRRRRRASATRASFLFCRNYFPGRAFCLISALCHFLFAGTRRSLSASVPSLRKLFLAQV